MNEYKTNYLKRVKNSIKIYEKNVKVIEDRLNNSDEFLEEIKHKSSLFDDYLLEVMVRFEFDFEDYLWEELVKHKNMLNNLKDIKVELELEKKN